MTRRDGRMDVPGDPVPEEGSAGSQRDAVGNVTSPEPAAPEARPSRVPRPLREWLVFALAVFLVYGLIIYYTYEADGINWAILVGIALPTLIYALFALGLNLQFGFTGLINFGHVGSLLLGAYVAAMVTLQRLPFASPIDLPEWFMGHSPVVGLLAGVAAAVLFGLVVGVPTLRLREDYLAIVTISAAEIIRIVLYNYERATGGSRGIHSFAVFGRDCSGEWPVWLGGGCIRDVAWFQDLAASLDVNDHQLFLVLLLLVLIILFMVVYEGLTRAPYGRVLKAIRDDEEVAASVGKNVFAYKLQVLILGSVVGALAGTVLAWWRSTLTPTPKFFGPEITFFAWIAVIIGGAGNNKGTILGAVFLWTLIFEGTRYVPVDEMLGFTDIEGAAFRFLLIGMLLIGLILLRPQGILGRKEEMVFGK